MARPCGSDRTEGRRGRAAYLLERPDLLTEDGERLLQTQIERIPGSKAGQLLTAMAVFRLPIPVTALRFSLSASDEPAGQDATVAALRALRDRSLVEWQGTSFEDGYFTLDPQLQRHLLDDDSGQADAHRQSARAWLTFAVPEGMEARSVDDVLPLLEAHHHLLEAGNWKEAVMLATKGRFGPANKEDLAEWLTRRGCATLRVAIESASANLAIRDEDPQIWSAAQNNVGIAYASLPTGDRAENLRSAIAAFDAALRVYTEKDYPSDWAMTQNNLGIAYKNLTTGDQAEDLENAIAAFDAALRVYTEKDYPSDWAMTQNNLGVAYRNLPTGDPAENLENAIASYDAALRV